MSDYVAGKAWKQEKYDHIIEEGFKLIAEKGLASVIMPFCIAPGPSNSCIGSVSEFRPHL